MCVKNVSGPVFCTMEILCSLPVFILIRLTWQLSRTSSWRGSRSSLRSSTPGHLVVLGHVWFSLGVLLLWNQLHRSLRADLSSLSFDQSCKHLKIPLFVGEDTCLIQECFWFKWRHINTQLRLRLWMTFMVKPELYLQQESTQECTQHESFWTVT